MKYLALFFLIFSTFSFASSSMQDLTPEKSKKKRKALSTPERKLLIELLEGNEELHAAFYKYSPEQINQVAKKMKSTLEKLRETQLAKAFKRTEKEILKLTTGKERMANNRAYSEFGKTLERVLDKWDVTSSYNVFYCPMVKMTWVQDIKKKAKVHNPFAPSMPHCGYQKTNF